MSVDMHAILGGVSVGAEFPVAVMGALNVSPESFYGGSVHVDRETLLRTALEMTEAGAVLIDVGARSTAPYGQNELPEHEEAGRLGEAVEWLAAKLSVPISADTCRPGPARAALEAGARVLNDVAGLADPAVAALVRAHRADVLLMASPTGAEGQRDPVATVSALLEAGLARSRAAGIPDERVVLDPGIGFFRRAALSWELWDATVLARLSELQGLGRPLAVGVSRKSFLGAITGRATPDTRLAASLAATTAAVLQGAALVRTHDVAETVDAVRVAEHIRRARRG
jgi:dihydropteroate synthase